MSVDNFFFSPEEFTGKGTEKRYGFIADPCLLCSLYKNCNSPKMLPFGDNEKRILVIGEAPGENEDKTGIQFVGRSGKLLNDALFDFGINMDIDCVRTNVQQCFVSGNTFLPEKAEFCYDRLEKQIKNAKPKLILCFGQEASKRVIENSIVPGLSKDAFGLVQGDVYISRKYNCWVSLNYHPAHILRNDDMLDSFYINLSKGLDHLGEELPKLMIDNSKAKNHYVDGRKAVEVIEKFSKSKIPVTVDYETNQLSSFLGEPKLLLVSLSNNEYEGFVIPLDPKDENIWKALSSFLKSNVSKTSHNSHFEEMWTRMMLGHPINNLDFDTILSAHIVDEKKLKKSLAYLAFVQTGEEYKDVVNNKDMENEIKTNFDNVVKYSSLDARYPVLIRKGHEDYLKRNKLESSMKFLMKGNEALADLEYNGVLIDMPLYEQVKEETIEKIQKAESYLLHNEYVEEYERKYHKKLDLNSNPALAKLFFKIMGLEPLSFTAKKGDPQVTQELFEAHKSSEKYGEFFTAFIGYKHLQRLKSNSIDSIEKYVDVNNFIHPSYHLWTVPTYRSSCDSPNLQNVPNRDTGMKEVRKIYIPRFDYFLELDFKGADISAIAMESGDKVLTKQINENMDIHRHWASKLFQMAEDKISKQQRFETKGGFVFAEFYGSYFRNIAESMGLSEKLVREVERQFWDMYDGVRKWKYYEERKYQENGYVTNALGFMRRAPLRKNQIIPSIIQGDMFLGFLLDTMIEVKKKAEKYKLKSLQVIQVHDSLTVDVVENEIEDVVDIMQESALDKKWEWGKNVKLEVEYTIGTNWLDMEKL